MGEGGIFYALCMGVTFFLLKTSYFPVSNGSPLTAYRVISDNMLYITNKTHKHVILKVYYKYTSFSPDFDRNNGDYNFLVLRLT